MSNIVKKGASYILVLIVLGLTVIAILGIWGIIEIELKEVLPKVFFSLMVVFVAAVVVLFIFAVLVRDNKTTGKNNSGNVHV
ncbi:MAG: hypothetical protein KJ607_12175 [Bacteroidetes bacterium]|nr:hypothetical protein [Bacteroidota bacterium]